MNKVMLIGNVGREPDIRYFDNDQAMATFTLATTERGYTLQNGTQVPDRTEWHNIVLNRGLAKVAEKFVHKGDKLYIEGRIRTRSYDDSTGKRRYVTEIYGENMELLTPKGASEGAARQGEGASPRQHPQPRLAAGHAVSPEPQGQADESDDLPF